MSSRGYQQVVSVGLMYITEGEMDVMDVMDVLCPRLVGSGSSLRLLCASPGLCDGKCAVSCWRVSESADL